MTADPSRPRRGRELLIEQAKLRVRQLRPQQVRQWLGQGALLLDLRAAEAFQQGHLLGAIWVDYLTLGATIDRLVPDFTRPIVCCSARGNRSALVAFQLQQLGYWRVGSLRGGVEAWDRRLVK
jgi:rhodanese-related sulfurtransferase